MREQRRSRYKAIKAKAMSSGCALCGAKAREFDHLDPRQKSFKVSAWYKTTLPESALMSEIGKCRPLCCCCHRLVTASQRPRTRRRRIARKRALNDAEKRRVGSCASCARKVVEGEEVAFDWDHTDRSTKLGSVSDLIDSGRSWKVVAEEVAKCQLLCADCHASKTTLRRDYLAIST